MLGKDLTLEDFKWDFPQKCYGTCETMEYVTKNKRSEKRFFGSWEEFTNVLGSKFGHGAYIPKVNQCTLPCLVYNTDTETGKTCMIHPEAYLAFASKTVRGGISSNDCGVCNGPKWSECWPTNYPRKMFTSEHGVDF